MSKFNVNDVNGANFELKVRCISLLGEDRQSNQKLWAHRLSEANQSNMSLRHWCGENGISYSAMRYWKRKLSPVEDQGNEGQGLKWIPLAPDPTNTPSHQGESFPSSILAKVSIGKCVVDIPEDFQPDQLYSLFKVLNAL